VFTFCHHLLHATLSCLSQAYSLCDRNTLSTYQHQKPSLLEVAKTCCKVQLHGQLLPAKKGKVRAKLTQTAQIQDWDSFTPEQQQETLNWGIDIDISSDSDEGMATATFTMVASGSGQTGGGGGAPGGSGGPPGGGGGGGSPPGGRGFALPTAPPTLDNLNRLMSDLGNVVGILAQQVLDITHD
jgi:uncharacterized membrane protein YgcG